MKINTFPDPWDLHYFQEIVRTGNLSRAAERLHIGQPALSLSLKRLEEQLGSALFFRRHRGLELTPAGQRLFKQSQLLQQTWTNLVHETQRSLEDISGHFRLGCHASVAIYALRSGLRDLYLQNPNLEIQLVHGLSREICEQVISGKIDFGLVINPIQHNDLVIRNLIQDEVCFWKSKIGLDDVLLYHPELVQSQILIKKLKKQVTIRRYLTSDNLEVIASLADAGLGMAILPQKVVEVRSKNLKKIEGYPKYQDSLCLIYRSDIPKTKSTQVILQKLGNLK